MIKSLIFIFLTPFYQSAHAEYRVYQYVLKNKVINAQDAPNSKIIISSLNPIAYKAYHGGGKILSIDLLRTWVCPGHTGMRRDYCASPYDQIIERVIK